MALWRQGKASQKAEVEREFNAYVPLLQVRLKTARVWKCQLEISCADNVPLFLSDCLCSLAGVHSLWLYLYAVRCIIVFHLQWSHSFSFAWISPSMLCSVAASDSLSSPLGWTRSSLPNAFGIFSLWKAGEGRTRCSGCSDWQVLHRPGVWSGVIKMWYKWLEAQGS